jgi:lysylphosphatidylglycerol synthetase-like protein (DUF2156 family)
MNKKAIFEGNKSILSLILGVILLTLGIIPLLNKLDVIKWQLPPIPKIVLLVLLSTGGFYLIIDGLIEHSVGSSLAWISIIVGLLVVTMGLIPLLNIFNIISLEFTFITVVMINIAFVVTGILLVIGAFML